MENSELLMKQNSKLIIHAVFNYILETDILQWQIHITINELTFQSLHGHGIKLSKCDIPSWRIVIQL